MNQIEIVAIEKSSFETFVKLGIGRLRKVRGVSDLGTRRNEFRAACRQAEITESLGLEIVNDHVGGVL